MSIIFILAALGITFGYTNPTYRGVSGSTDISKKSVTELILEKTQYEEALKKTKEIEEVRNGLLTKYNLITEVDRNNLNKMIPDNIDSVRLIIDVNNIAVSYNMSLRDIAISDAPVSVARRDDPVSVVSSSIFSNIILSFSVTGTYSNLVSFLSDLERNLRLNDIESVSIETSLDTAREGGTSTSKTTDDPQYKMLIAFKTYFLDSE